MNRSTDDALERIKLREVAALFHSPEALESAAEALLLAGFDRADIDRLADLDEVSRRLGPVYVAHEELADVAQAPRQLVIVRDDIMVTIVLVVTVLASLAGVIAAFIAVASGRGTAAAIIDALLAALVAGTIGALFTIHLFRPAQSRALEPHMAARGLVLWVRVRTPDREDKAQKILREYGGQAIRVHEIELEKRPDEIPLSSLRPDPWLGDERLGHPSE